MSKPPRGAEGTQAEPRARTAELDEVLATVAAYYWLRPQHLAVVGAKHKIIKNARRIAAHYGLKMSAPWRVAPPLGLAPDHLGQASCKGGLQSRLAIDARAIGRRLAA